MTGKPDDVVTEELTEMNTLAYTGGPGPWILLFPVIWAAVVVGAVTVLRRTVWRGGGGWRTRAGHRATLGERAPVALLGRRFAAGEIDEEEYWRRLSVLDEPYGRYGKDGAA